MRWDGERWRLERERSVDTTRFDPQAAARLRAHWAEVARDRITRGAEGTFLDLAFSTDERTLDAIAELRRRFLRELRALVASAPRARRVAVVDVNLFPIGGGALTRPPK